MGYTLCDQCDLPTCHGNHLPCAEKRRRLASLGGRGCSVATCQGVGRYLIRWRSGDVRYCDYHTPIVAFISEPWLASLGGRGCSVATCQGVGRYLIRWRSGDVRYCDYHTPIVAFISEPSGGQKPTRRRR